MSKSFILTYLIFFLINLSVIYAQTCTANICGSNGQCVVLNGQIKCICNTGYVGSRCQLIDPCLTRPCGKNGACFPVLGNSSTTNTLIETTAYYCQCYYPYSGVNCQNANMQFGPCYSNPCFNGGTCTNSANSWSYTCNCTASYTGPQCATYVDICANSLCQNKALCTANYPLMTNYSCTCMSGYYGQYCEKEINECLIIDNNGRATSPCGANGQCVDLVDAYLCNCNIGYSGTNCQIYNPVNTNPCNPNPCPGGAACTVSGSSYTCSCSAGTFGALCQTNPCNNNPCKLPGSQCIPIDLGGVSTPGCGCSNQAPSYICLCPNSNPSYGSSSC